MRLARVVRKDVLLEGREYLIEFRWITRCWMHERIVENRPRHGGNDGLAANVRKMTRDQVRDLMAEPPHRRQVEIER
jgi:hypothetical protein